MPIVTRESSRYFGAQNGRWFTDKPLKFDVKPGSLKEPRYIGIKQLVIEWNDTTNNAPKDFSGYVSCQGCTGLDNEEGQIMIFAKPGFQIDNMLKNDFLSRFEHVQENLEKKSNEKVTSIEIEHSEIEYFPFDIQKSGSKLDFIPKLNFISLLLII